MIIYLEVIYTETLKLHDWSPVGGTPHRHVTTGEQQCAEVDSSLDWINNVTVDGQMWWQTLNAVFAQQSYDQTFGVCCFIAWGEMQEHIYTHGSGQMRFQKQACITKLNLNIVWSEMLWRKGNNVINKTESCLESHTNFVWMSQSWNVIVVSLASDSVKCLYNRLCSSFSNCWRTVD